jgi:hypothetical protein
MALINWLLKPKCMLIHILFWNFFCCVKIWCYNIYIYILERLGRMHENKTFFVIMYFLMFWRKTGILIPDLYLYSIKIQTDIDQNTVIKLQKITYFWNNFWRIFVRTGQTRPKRRLGRNRPKIKRAYFPQGWTQSSPKQQ